MAARAPSLRREILAWYSVVLVVALSIFATAAYFLLQRAVVAAEEESMRQTVRAMEEASIPPMIPRVSVGEDYVTMITASGEPVQALRRRVLLVTGDLYEFAAPRGNVESRALRSFLFISLVL